MTTASVSRARCRASATLLSLCFLFNSAIKIVKAKFYVIAVSSVAVMGRYPRAAREAAVKCIGCNAPAVRTVGGEYVCVDCGQSLFESRDSAVGD